jgi:hypothetical protein
MSGQLPAKAAIAPFTIPVRSPGPLSWNRRIRGSSQLMLSSNLTRFTEKWDLPFQSTCLISAVLWSGAFAGCTFAFC